MKNSNAQKCNDKKIPSKFIYLVVIVFLLKLVIIFNIDGKQAGSAQSCTILREFGLALMVKITSQVINFY